MMGKLDSIEAYPLEWPPAWKRNQTPKRASFHSKKATGWGTRQKTVAESRDFLLEELRRLGVTNSANVVISTNIRTRNDGLPYSNASEPDDSGVAVYFLKDDEQICMPCDTYDRVADNLYAVAKVIEAMRAIERHGSDMMNAAFTGFQALPENGSGTKWWEVLEVSRHASMQEIRKAHRLKSMEHHPDKGGDPEMFHAIQTAFQQANNAIN